MKDIDKASLWYGDEDTVTIEGGRLFDPDAGRGRTARLPLAAIHDTDLPMEPVDYCITVTTVDGDHLHTEVTAATRTKAHLRVTLAPTGPALLQP